MDFYLLWKNMGKTIGIKINKCISSKYSQKLLEHAKQYATDAFKTSSKNSFSGSNH